MRRPVCLYYFWKLDIEEIRTSVCIDPADDESLQLPEVYLVRRCENVAGSIELCNNLHPGEAEMRCFSLD